jgi:hypothetical protein
VENSPIAVIVNPASGVGKTLKLLPSIAEAVNLPDR